MELSAIKFNGGLDPAAGSALTLRQNFASAVAVPEWTKDQLLAKSSPVAYAIAAVAGQIIPIQVSFTLGPGEPAAVEVRADGGGVLGAIDPVMIHPQAG